LKIILPLSLSALSLSPCCSALPLSLADSTRDLAYLAAQWLETIKNKLKTNVNKLETKKNK